MIWIHELSFAIVVGITVCNVLFACIYKKLVSIFAASLSAGVAALMAVDILHQLL
jgi:hypothetical protein